MACKRRNSTFGCELLNYIRTKSWIDGKLDIEDYKRLRLKYIWIRLNFEPTIDWITLHSVQEWEQGENSINGYG